MLKQFNTFVHKLISEAATEESDEKIIKDTYHCNEFYAKFLQNLGEECSVVVTKQRQNCFLVYGVLKNVKDFFTKLKVDKTFMDNPEDFRIYTPMFSYGETAHNLKLDEDYPIYKQAGIPTQTHEVDNIVRQTVFGKWYPLFDEKKPCQKIKGLKPSEITKYFKQTFPKATKDFNEEVEIYVEFQVNCEDWNNLIYDAMTEYAKDPDEMNDAHNEDPDDFDYTSLNVKDKQDDEKEAKKTLKDVKTKKEDIKPTVETKKAPKVTNKK